MLLDLRLHWWSGSKIRVRRHISLLGLQNMLILKCCFPRFYGNLLMINACRPLSYEYIYIIYMGTIVTVCSLFLAFSPPSCHQSFLFSTCHPSWTTTSSPWHSILPLLIPLILPHSNILYPINNSKPSYFCWGKVMNSVPILYLACQLIFRSFSCIWAEYIVSIRKGKIRDSTAKPRKYRRQRIPPSWGDPQYPAHTWRCTGHSF